MQFEHNKKKYLLKHFVYMPQNTLSQKQHNLNYRPDTCAVVQAP